MIRSEKNKSNFIKMLFSRFSSSKTRLIDNINNLPKIFLNENKSNIYLLFDDALDKEDVLNIKSLLEKERLNVSLIENNHLKNTNRKIEEYASSFIKRRCDSILVLGRKETISLAKLISLKVNNENIELSEINENSIIKRNAFLVVVPSLETSSLCGNNKTYLFDLASSELNVILNKNLVVDYVLIDENINYLFEKEDIVYTLGATLCIAIETYRFSENKKEKEYLEKTINLLFLNLLSYEENKKELLLSYYYLGLAQFNKVEGMLVRIERNLQGTKLFPFGSVIVNIFSSFNKECGKRGELNLVKLSKKYKLTPESAPETVKAHALIEKCESLLKKLIKYPLTISILKRDLKYSLDKIYETQSSLNFFEKKLSLNEINKMLSNVIKEV